MPCEAAVELQQRGRVTRVCTVKLPTVHYATYSSNTWEVLTEINKRKVVEVWGIRRHIA